MSRMIGTLDGELGSVDVTRYMEFVYDTDLGHDVGGTIRVRYELYFCKVEDSKPEDYETVLVVKNYSYCHSKHGPQDCWLEDEPLGHSIHMQDIRLNPSRADLLYPDLLYHSDESMKCRFSGLDGVEESHIHTVKSQRGSTCPPAPGWVFGLYFDSSYNPIDFIKNCHVKDSET